MYVANADRWTSLKGDRIVKYKATPMERMVQSVNIWEAKQSVNDMKVTALLLTN